MFSPWSPAGGPSKIVDLGCGWGSLTLFLAEKYPNSSITSISNSATQKILIDGKCKVRWVYIYTLVGCQLNVSVGCQLGVLVV